MAGIQRKYWTVTSIDGQSSFRANFVKANEREEQR